MGDEHGKATQTFSSQSFAFFAAAGVALISLYSQTCKKVILDCHQKHTNLQRKLFPSISPLTTLPRCIFIQLKFMFGYVRNLVFSFDVCTDGRKNIIKSSCFDMNLHRTKRISNFVCQKVGLLFALTMHSALRMKMQPSIVRRHTNGCCVQKSFTNETIKI